MNEQVVNNPEDKALVTVKLCIGIEGVQPVGFLGDEGDWVHEHMMRMGPQAWFDSLGKVDSPCQGMFELDLLVSFDSDSLVYEVTDIRDPDCACQYWDSEREFDEQAILQDPSTSYWLKEQLKRTGGRDPVDAINDTEVLLSVLKTRLMKLQAKEQIQ